MLLSRRHFLKGSACALGGLALCDGGVIPGHALAGEGRGSRARVFWSRELGPEGLRRIYARVNEGIGGRTAVKVHTGEPNGPNIIPPDWVRAFMADIPDSSIVECNVLYGSPRKTTAGHRQTLETNGWTFCPVDIMDAEGDVMLPVRGGKWFGEVAFGKNILDYDSMIVLTHFKGHVMGGFGGALKNIAIGCASGRAGKEQLHREGDRLWAGGPNFMERMAEGGKAVADHFGPRITYLNVLRNMSVSCDCEGMAAEPVRVPDLGILASRDLLAIDQASVDMIFALAPDVRAPLVERINTRSGLRQLSRMKELGMGKAEYDLIEV